MIDLFRFHLSPRGISGLIPASQTIRVAEAFRSALLASLPTSKIAEALAGHGYLAKDHAHAHFLPIDRDADGLIDALDVWLPLGCDGKTEEVLLKTRVVYDGAALKGGLLAEPVGSITAPRATHWETATPLVLDRFPKLRGTGEKHIVDSPEEQIAKAIARRNLHAKEICVKALSRRELNYVRARNDRGRPLPAFHASVAFDQAIEGPLVLGSLAHFGLGRFDPIRP